MSAFFNVLSFSIAANSFIYGIGFPVISRFKDNAPPKDFETAGMSEFHAALGLELMRRKEELFASRHVNGTYLLRGLTGLEGLILPDIPEDNYTVFNRLPVLFRDPGKVTLAADALRKSGIETSQMYLRPLHRMFDLEYGEDDFPTASYFAERLLTLPVHPAVGRGTLSKIIDVIRQI
jgi:dTDP-4-amino-4,6-dideoxygalactose transaminase